MNSSPGPARAGGTDSQNGWRDGQDGGCPPGFALDARQLACRRVHETLVYGDQPCGKPLGCDVEAVRDVGSGPAENRMNGQPEGSGLRVEIQPDDGFPRLGVGRSVETQGPGRRVPRDRLGRRRGRDAHEYHLAWLHGPGHVRDQDAARLGLSTSVAVTCAAMMTLPSAARSPDVVHTIYFLTSSTRRFFARRPRSYCLQRAWYRPAEPGRSIAKVCKVRLHGCGTVLRQRGWRPPLDVVGVALDFEFSDAWLLSMSPTGASAFADSGLIVAFPVSKRMP